METKQEGCQLPSICEEGRDGAAATYSHYAVEISMQQDITCENAPRDCSQQDTLDFGIQLGSEGNCVHGFNLQNVIKSFTRINLAGGQYFRDQLLNSNMRQYEDKYQVQLVTDVTVNSLGALTGYVCIWVLVCVR